MSLAVSSLSLSVYRSLPLLFSLSLRVQQLACPALCNCITKLKCDKVRRCYCVLFLTLIVTPPPRLLGWSTRDDLETAAWLLKMLKTVGSGFSGLVGRKSVDKVRRPRSFLLVTRPLILLLLPPVLSFPLLNFQVHRGSSVFRVMQRPEE